VPSFSHSVELSQPPEAVFPWLLEEDKVPQWTSDLQSYSVEGPLGPGAKVQQTLDVAGGLKLTMDIVGYEPPRTAQTRFETNGVKVESSYLVEPSGSGSRLTQTLEAKAGGLTGRMLIPVVQGRLEKKLTADLERLRGVLAGT
jgi:carbon monoxide dehydrogenase subunit G